MPPKLKENTVTGYCTKVHEPPKGVGGPIIQSIELKRNVSQSKRGNKVFERAIEERQFNPGVSTTRVGTKIYFFDNEASGFNAKMESLNNELNAKCGEMDELDASLADNEMRMAKLDAELEKLNISGDDAIEEAIITESEDLDLLLVPSIQNLIFKIYSESGIAIPSDSSDKSKKSSKDDLKEICKKFCKDEFEKLERDKNKQNLQQRQCDRPSPAEAGGNSPCINLSTASELSEIAICDPLPRNWAQPPQAAAQNRQRASPAAASPLHSNRQNVRSPLEQCIEDCQRNRGNAAPEARSPSPSQEASPCNETSSYSSSTSNERDGAFPPITNARRMPCQETFSSSSSCADGQDGVLAACIEDCERQHDCQPSPARNRPPELPRAAASQRAPAVHSCPLPVVNRARPAASGCQPPAPSGLAACLGDCERQHGSPPSSARNRPPVSPRAPAAPRAAALPRAPAVQSCPLPARNRATPAAAGCQPPAPSGLAACLEDCERHHSSPPSSARNRPPVSPRTPAVSRAAAPSRAAAAQSCQLPAVNRDRPAAAGCQPPTPSGLAACLEDCERQHGQQQRLMTQNRQQSPAPRCQLPPVNRQNVQSPPPSRRLNRQRSPTPAGAAPTPNRQNRTGGLEQCLENCNNQFGQPQAPAGNRARSPPNRQRSPSSRPPSPCGADRGPVPTERLDPCLEDCERDFGHPVPPRSMAPLRNSSPSPPQNRGASPTNRCRPAPPRAPSPNQGQRQDGDMTSCIEDCERRFGNNRPPVSVNQPQVRRPNPITCRPSPTIPRLPQSLEDCVKGCEKKFGNLCKKKQITPRPPLFSRLVNGKRCFPELSEIQKKDQTLFMAERDAYILFRRQHTDRGNDATFYEQPNEFDEFFYKYINGSSKINVAICSPSPPATPKPPEKTPSDELVQTFVNLQKIEIDTVLQRNVVDLALDRPDRDPEIIAILMNERIPLWIDSLITSEMVTPYPLHKRLFATDVRLTAPGSMVPRTIPVQALNVMNTHVMDGVEAIIKSNEYPYPVDNIAKALIDEINVVRQEPEENAEEEPAPDNYKCLIELHPFRVETFFQLRGANVPLWYPGMFTAFPDGRSSIKLVNSPSALINTAWRMCAP